jgi:hypothetical protein
MKSLIKHLIILLLSIFMSATLSLADTTSTRVVVPGMVHTEISLPGPYVLDILEIDLKSPVLQLETYRANGLAATSAQAAANDSEGHRAIAAVNGDFFSASGWPVDNTVVNGKTIFATLSFRSHLALTEDSRPYIEQFSFSGMFVAKNGNMLAIDGVNTARVIGTTMLYNSYYGAATGTDGTGAECSLTPLFTTWRANDTLLFVVAAKQSSGNMSIPPAGMVLSSGSGAPTTFVTDNISVNDTVKVYVGFNPKSIKKIVHLLGGAGRLVKNGVNVAISSAGAEGLAGAFYNIRNPRTFVGFNADTTKFYFCTVDRKTNVSLGMNFDEMANFLLSIKVSDAFNLDGGGSTTMVVRGKVVNYTSDIGDERPVANTLQVICTAPTGTLSYFDIAEESVTVVQGDTFKFHAKGKDFYASPIPLLAFMNWNADSTIGAIDSAGVFIAKKVIDSGWVRVHYKTFSDSARVIVVKPTTGVIGKHPGGVSIFSLEQNYPNPFNPATVISYQLPVNSFVTLKVFDLLGRTAATLVNGTQGAGVQKVEWDGGIASGVYYYRLEAVSLTDPNNRFVQVKEMVLLK